MGSKLCPRTAKTSRAHWSWLVVNENRMAILYGKRIAGNSSAALNKIILPLTPNVNSFTPKDLAHLWESILREVFRQGLDKIKSSTF